MEKLFWASVSDVTYVKSARSMPGVEFVRTVGLMRLGVDQAPEVVKLRKVGISDIRRPRPALRPLYMRSMMLAVGSCWPM